MNKVAQTFRQLMDCLSHTPESDDVPLLLAGVAANLGPAQPTCLALQTRLTAHWPLSAAASLLAPYGVVLKARARSKRDGVWIFAEYREPEPSAFLRARVVVLEPEDAMPKAA